MSEYKIHAGLDKTFKDLSLGSVVAWPNRKYKPVNKTTWYRPTFLPNKPRQETLGTNGKNRFTGIYQVDIYLPAGAGKKPAEDAAAVIVAAFKRGTTITYSGVDIRCEAAYWRLADNEVIRGETWFRAIVEIAWRSDVSN